jgi:hypothetical protein
MKRTFEKNFAAANQSGWHKCMPQYGGIMESDSLNYSIYDNLIYGKSTGNS